MKWIIYELRIWNQVKLCSSQLWTQFLQLRKEAWKIQDFNGVWARDLAIPVRRSNQLSYEATDVRSWSFVGSNNIEISFHRWFIHHGNIRTHKWPAPNVSDFIVHLVRASHRYREVTGSNPVEVVYFSGFFMQFAKIAFITARMIASRHIRASEWMAGNPGLCQFRRFWEGVRLSAQKRLMDDSEPVWYPTEDHQHS